MVLHKFNSAHFPQLTAASVSMHSGKILFINCLVVSISSTTELVICSSCCS